MTAALLVSGACSTGDSGEAMSELEQCPVADADDMRATVEAALGWADRALLANGKFVYEYDREEGTLSDHYHIVRHAGLVMSLYIAASHGYGKNSQTETPPSSPPATPDNEDNREETPPSTPTENAPPATPDSDTEATSPRETADAGLGYLIDRVVTIGDRAAVVQPGREAVLGTTALTTASLVFRRQATGDHSYDDMMRAMGRFMESSVTANGKMWSHATPGDLQPIVGRTSTFYTGEAFWAFGLLANTFHGEGWDEPAGRVGRYIATQRDADEAIEQPPHPDQWAAYGFSEMRDWAPLEDAELDYVRRLVARYHTRLVTEIGRERERVGDGTSEPDESVTQARGAGFGTTVEALSALWRLSKADPGLADLEETLRSDLVCGASILVARQVDPARAARLWPDRADLVEGAWYDENVSRLDDQQHALTGVALAVAAAQPAAPG